MLKRGFYVSGSMRGPSYCSAVNRSKGFGDKIVFCIQYGFCVNYMALFEFTTNYSDSVYMNGRSDWLHNFLQNVLQKKFFNFF